MNIKQELKKVYDLGVWLIPVHEKAKNPYIKYREQEKRPDFLELLECMDLFGTTSFAAVLGAKSGGLCCIDVDTKNNIGFEVELFRDLELYYPELYRKMRVEKTPSGGYHLFYRFFLDGSGLGGYPNYGAVASRWASAEELAADPKRKSYCFLEVKCEGALSQIYPSYQYHVLEGHEDIGVLTWDEHYALVNLCYGYNTVVKEVKIKEPTGAWIDIYDVKPWEHFNKSEEGSKILEDRGWGRLWERGGVVYYEKPDRNKKEVSATYHKKGNFYKIWSESVSVDAKSYTPSSLLCALDYGTDVKSYKRLNADLVAKGYGKIKEKVEERIVIQAARSGAELPNNVSFTGMAKYEEEKERFGGMYPYGVFWETNGEVGLDLGYEISRLRLLEVSSGLGVRLFGQDIVKIEGYFIEYLDERGYYDLLKGYLGESEGYEDIYNCLDLFIQKSGKHIISQLEKLDVELVCRSTKDVGYKGYLNGYVEITEDGYELKEWGSMNFLFWKHQIQDRDFIMGDLGAVEGSLYYRFLEKACGITENLKKCIGYYAHEYKSTMTPYVVILCEMTENPKHGGGTGKNVFTNLMKFFSSLLNKPAKNIKFDDTLLRRWKNEKIFSLNDAEKGFDYLGLRELSSGDGEVGKKFLQETTIDEIDMPKFIVNTNYSFDPSLPGLKRRMIPLEFTDFFSRAGGVDVYFGKSFPFSYKVESDWEREDWIGFDNFVMECIREFIVGGCKLIAPELTDGGWRKQFEGKYSGLTMLFIEENIDRWLDGDGCVEIAGVFNKKYEDFCNENNIDRRYRMSSIRMNDALELYCERYGIDFQKSYVKRDATGTFKCKRFVRKGEAERVGLEEQEEEFNLF